MFYVLVKQRFSDPYIYIYIFFFNKECMLTVKLHLPLHVKNSPQKPVKRVFDSRYSKQYQVL